MEFISNTGIFFYPLLFCSLLLIYISIERSLALRDSVILPDTFMASLLSGTLIDSDFGNESLAGRLVGFLKTEHNLKDQKLLKAFVQLELSRLERGLFILEIITGIAPLIGLLGTVYGLTHVFGTFSVESGFSQQGDFVSGIALALNTTILGLIVAIPSLTMHSFLQRRIDVIAGKLKLSIESLLINKSLSTNA